MAILLALWGALMLPGYALLRLYGKEELEGGLLPTVAASYLATLVLLSPFSLLGYGLQLPIEVLSAAIVVLIAGAVWILSTGGRWRGLITLIRGELVVGVLLLIAHLVMEARLGSWLQGDATFHVGRARYLLEHGFNNRDIYLAEPFFTRIYHTNLVHALIAAIGQLTFTKTLETWFYSAAVAKLMIAAGHAYFAYAIFGARWVGWVLAVLAMTTQAGTPYALYPNTLAVGFALPTLLGLSYSALSQEPVPKRTAIKLALGALTLGQIHLLYGVFLGLCASVPLLLEALRRAMRRQSVAGVAWCLVALCACGPALVIYQLGGPPETARPDSGPSSAELSQSYLTLAAQQKALRQTKKAVQANIREAERLAKAGGGHLEKELQRLPGKRFVLSPKAVGGAAFALVALAALTFCLARLRQQRRALIGLATTTATLSAFLFIPAICTFIVEVADASFVIARLTPVLAMCMFAACSGAALALVGTWNARWLKSAVVVAAAAIGTQLTGHSFRRFEEHVDQILEPEQQRFAPLRRAKNRRKLLRHVPEGKVVLSTLQLARHIVMLHDCYVIAADRGHTSVPNIAQRRVEVLQLLTPKMKWKERLKRLRRNQVRHLVFLNREKRLFGWALRHGIVEGRSAGWTVVRFKLSER